jgi:hypothetical protein
MPRMAVGLFHAPFKFIFKNNFSSGGKGGHRMGLIIHLHLKP